MTRGGLEREHLIQRRFVGDESDTDQSCACRLESGRLQRQQPARL